MVVKEIRDILQLLSSLEEEHPDMKFSLGKQFCGFNEVWGSSFSEVRSMFEGLRNKIVEVGNEKKNL